MWLSIVLSSTYILSPYMASINWFLSFTTPGYCAKDLIRLNFPKLTEESRKELVKVLYKKLEESRISLRKQRDKIKETIIALEKTKEINEDEKFTSLKELDNIIKDYNNKIKTIGEDKEKEIMTI